jgi:hypothetical protein
MAERDEVGHQAVTEPDDPLTEVADTSAENKSTTDCLRHGADARHEDPEHDHSDPEKNGDQGLPPAEQAEGQSGVELQRQTEGPPQMDRLVEVVFGHCGGHTVGDHDDGGQ